MTDVSNDCEEPKIELLINVYTENIKKFRWQLFGIRESNFSTFYEHNRERPNLKSQVQVLKEKEFELKGLKSIKVTRCQTESNPFI